MKTTFISLAVILALASPIAAQQKASDEIKADAAIASESALSPGEKAALIQEAREQAIVLAKAQAKARVRDRIRELLEADADLRSRLINE